MRRTTLAITLLAATLCLSCSNLTTVPPVLVGRAPDAPSDAELQRLIAAVRAVGYEPGPIQPEQGRFAVRARYGDSAGAYTFAVACFQDGRVLITPVGPHVQRRQRYYVLPRLLREELLELARVLEDAVRRPA